MAEPRDPDRERFHERERAGDYGSEPVGGERYVAGEPTHRSVEPDPKAPYPSERREVRRPVRTETESYVPAEGDYRGVRYGSTGPYLLELKDTVRWGPIFAGFAATMATLMMMGVLGAAIGTTTLEQQADAVTPGAGTFGLIWGAISLILAFFVGGWLAAKTSGIGGQMSALVNSGIVWAFTLLFVLFLASLGFAGLAGVVTDLTFGGLTIDAETSATAAWGTLLGLILGLASALVGGLVGMHKEPEPVSR